jgi:tRNA G10  N-methylase Trm11
MTAVYLLYGGVDERELALAEADALAGALPCAERLVESDQTIDLARAAYLSRGVELIVRADCLEEAADRLGELKLEADGFAIEVIRVPRSLAVSRREVAHGLGWVIGGRPDLEAPTRRFLAIATEDGVWFGHDLGSPEPAWQRFVKKPYDFSSSLPSQMARAVCNLVVRPGDRIVDPCCGTGSFLLHAASMGADVTGFDINPKMVGATNKNSEHFGFAARAKRADATKLEGYYDCALANLPYGNMTATTEAKTAAMVAAVVSRAPRGVIISDRDLRGEVRQAGATIERTVRVRKRSMTRWIMEFRQEPPPAR